MRAAGLILGPLLWGAVSAGAVTLEDGVLGEAPYRIAAPERWTGGVLLLAHGWRPADAPVIAVLDPADPLVDAYLERGWLVAATGYRRNGWIFADAAEDLRVLLDHVRTAYGEPDRIVFEGTSLGADIGLWLAESEPPPMDGLVALAPDPGAEGPDGPVAWTWNPRIPVLMLADRDEFGPLEDYAGRVGGEGIRPALWILDRDGHVNLNAAERLDAHAALVEWLEGGVRPPGWVGEPHDATVALPPPVSRARARDGGLEGLVVRIDPVYGNIRTDLVRTDLEVVVGRPGGRFLVRAFASEEPIRWGTTYDDVPAGRLVAFVAADGLVEIAVNRGDAAARLGVTEGDRLVVLPGGRRKNDPRN